MHITGIVPDLDTMPDWAQAAFLEGQFFYEALKRVRELEVKKFATFCTAHPNIQVLCDLETAGDCPACRAEQLAEELKVFKEAGWRSCIDHIIKPEHECPVCRLETENSDLRENYRDIKDQVNGYAELERALIAIKNATSKGEMRRIALQAVEKK